MVPSAFSVRPEAKYTDLSTGKHISKRSLDLCTKQTPDSEATQSVTVKSFTVPHHRCAARTLEQGNPWMDKIA